LNFFFFLHSSGKLEIRKCLYGNMSTVLGDRVKKRLLELDHEGIQSWWRRCIKSWNIYNLEMTAGIAASWLSPSLIYTTKGCCWSTIGGSLSPVSSVYLGNQLRTCLHLGLFPSGLSLFSRHLLNLIFRPWMGLKWSSPLHWLPSTNRNKELHLNFKVGV
jgi:hypothetical protein